MYKLLHLHYSDLKVKHVDKSIFYGILDLIEQKSFSYNNHILLYFQKKDSKLLNYEKYFCRLLYKHLFSYK